MGFHRRYIPEIEVLQKLRESFESDEAFYKHFTNKADSIIGSSESVNYLNEMGKKLKEQKESKDNGDQL